MSATAVVQEFDRIRQWPFEWQVQLAEELNALTWHRQWDALCARVHARALSAPVSDEEIDEIVRDVRREKPLRQR
jgi:hypothetical protein